MAVVLNFEDDETLYMTATALANIADKLDRGEEIHELANLLRVGSMTIAAVMAGAYERAVDAASQLN